MPVYGPLNVVVPPETSSQWLTALLDERQSDPNDALAVMQLARRTQDRYRDIDEALRRRTLDWLEDQHAAEHYRQLVREGGRLDEEEQMRVFGESLPKGLRLA
jgi:hypothetical protein